MSGLKKKVEFSDKNSVKKFKPHQKRDSDEDDDQNDSNSDGENAPDKIKKHTLDSDEEDNTEKIVKLKRSALSSELEFRVGACQQLRLKIFNCLLKTWKRLKRLSSTTR